MIREVEPLIECAADYVADNPRCTRIDVARHCGVSYSRVRYWLEKMVKGGFYYKGEFQHEGWLNKIVEYIGPRARRVYYELRRHRLMNVWSFNYKLFEAPVTRHVEVICEVDKPKFIFLSPNYVIRVFLDYSGFTFTIPSYRAAKYMRERYTMTLEKWMPKQWVAKTHGVSVETVEKWLKEGARQVGFRKTVVEVPGLWVAGGVEEVDSEYGKGEVYVYLEYTDYDYPYNSFESEVTLSLEDWKRGELFKKLVAWILEVCMREFGWGQPGTALGKYGIVF